MNEDAFLNTALKATGLSLLATLMALVSSAVWSGVI